MDACTSCGAALSADAQWCGQCYAVRGVPAAAPAAAPVSSVFAGGTASVMAPSRLAPTPSALPATLTRSRWRKTATTFGPLGRILATIALVVPFIVFVVIAVFTGGMILAAPVIWGFFIMPWGLRDTWKAGQVSPG